MDYLGFYRHLVNFTSTAPLEIYLLRKMLTCSILIVFLKKIQKGKVVVDFTLWKLNYGHYNASIIF